MMLKLRHLQLLAIMLYAPAAIAEDTHKAYLDLDPIPHSYGSYVEVTLHDSFGIPQTKKCATLIQGGAEAYCLNIDTDVINVFDIHSISMRVVRYPDYVNFGDYYEDID